jgi:hypothetical protein
MQPGQHHILPRPYPRMIYFDPKSETAR